MPPKIIAWSALNSIHLLTGMRVIALLLSPRYKLFSEATPRKIVGTEGTIKVLLPEYQVYKCFIILNNCAIQNSKLGPFLMDF
jgi:hypothetical protein